MHSAFQKFLRNLPGFLSPDLSSHDHSPDEKTMYVLSV
jgi:hypothetical protein